MSDKPQIINHKETIEKVLYDTNFSTTSSDGREFPKCKVDVKYITYTGERLNKEDKYEKYEGDKIVISVAKLGLNDGNIEVVKKIMTNRKGEPYIVDDKKEIILSVDELNHLLTNIDLDLKKK